MRNPWLDLQPIGDRLVHLDDAAYVDAFNEAVGPEHRLVTSELHAVHRSYFGG